MATQQNQQEALPVARCNPEKMTGSNPWLTDRRSHNDQPKFEKRKAAWMRHQIKAASCWRRRRRPKGSKLWKIS